MIRKFIYTHLIHWHVSSGFLSFVIIIFLLNTCPHFVKVETLEDDITEVFEHEFGMAGDQFLFPRVKTMGSKKVPGSRERSGSFLTQYYGQLTNNQIMGLYELYKTDFLLFDYNIQEFLN